MVGLLSWYRVCPPKVVYVYITEIAVDYNHTGNGLLAHLCTRVQYGRCTLLADTSSALRDRTKKKIPRLAPCSFSMPTAQGRT